MHACSFAPPPPCCSAARVRLAPHLNCSRVSHCSSTLAVSLFCSVTTARSPASAPAFIARAVAARTSHTHAAAVAQEHSLARMRMHMRVPTTLPEAA